MSNEKIPTEKYTYISVIKYHTSKDRICSAVYTEYPDFLTMQCSNEKTSRHLDHSLIWGILLTRGTPVDNFSEGYCFDQIDELIKAKIYHCVGVPGQPVYAQKYRLRCNRGNLEWLGECEFLPKEKDLENLLREQKIKNLSP